MSFINSQTSAYIYAKLTDTGRQLLAQGALTYNYWVLGDSEADYGFYSVNYDLVNNKVVAPKDKNPNIKYPLSSNLNGNIFNTLPAITPSQQIITNVAETRGFFTGNTTIITDKYKGKGTVTNGNITGGSGLTISITSGYISSGDNILIQLKNPAQTTATTGITSSTVLPYLFYGVQSITSATGTTSIVVDRLLPNLTSGTGSCDIYVFPSGDTINNFYGSASTIPYWSDSTLSFQTTFNVSNYDVKVWNFNIVYTENLAGIDTSIYEGINQYNSITFSGFKEYLNYTSQNSNQKAIGIIHFTNNSISNFYGEGFKTGTVKLNLPTILWHKINPSGGSGTGSNIGLLLSAQTTNQSIGTSGGSFNTQGIPFNVNYDNLVDYKGNVVGKIFIDLKIIVIEDEELIAAMSFKSNRNWSLPTLNGNFTNALSESQGLLTSNQEVYVTCLLGNTTTGYTTGLHGQNYTKISRGGVSQNNVKITFPINQLPFLKTSLDATGGITTNKLYLLAQVVTVGQRPVSNNWKIMDYTSSINGYVSGNVNPLSIEASNFTIDLATYNSAPTYVLDNFINIPFLNQTNILEFGDESFFFGNLDAQIVATVYKAPFLFLAPSAQFNNSVNPTYNPVINDSVYITEVGIYNGLQQLVAIGKISNPIKKKSSDSIQIQLEIDF